MPIPLIKRKKNRGRAATVAAIGTILVLNDGTKCQVLAHDKNGDPLRTPVKD